MATNITHAELCSESGATLFGKYRARLFNASEVPVISEMPWMMGKEVVVIDRFPEPANEVSLATNEKDDIPLIMGDSTQESKNQSSHSSEFGGSPLKFEFLTLSKLQARDGPKVSVDLYDCSVAVKEFDCTFLKVIEARTLAGKLVTSDTPFDAESVPNPVIWIVCDASDFLHTSLLGLQKSNRGTATYHVRSLPRNYPDVIKFLESYMECFYDSFKIYADRAYCVYDVIPMKSRVSGATEDMVSGFVELHVSWKFMSADRFSGAVLSKPPPSASVIAKISPGWLDDRMPLLELASELELILALGHALRTGEMTWPLTDQLHEDKKFMKSALRSLLSRTATFTESENLKASDGLDIPRDFTEELWLVLNKCGSNQGLTEALRTVFDALRSGYKNTMVLANNKSTMARLLRDACANELLLPRLEGLTPVQICLEMGLERLRRACMDEFLNRGYFETVAEIDAIFDCRSRKEPQDQADALFLFYNSLLVVNICKQYFRLDRHHMNIIARQVLGQYNKLNISPTTDHVTEDLIEKLIFTLDSRLSFTDVFKPVHKYKIPTIWKSDVTVEAGSKQGWMTRSMILFSRTTRFSFIKNQAGKDVEAKKLGPNKENTEQFDSSMDNSNLKMRRNFIPEKPLSCLNEEEKLEMDAALHNYYVTVVTGSFHVPFIKC